MVACHSENCLAWRPRRDTTRRAARIVPEMTRERRRERRSLPLQKAYRCAHQKILMRQRLCVILSRVP